MENLSTPIADKKWQSLDANETMDKSNIDENEQITFKNSPIGSDSLFFGNISPIDHSKNISREVMPDHQNDESNTIAQDDETSFKFNDSTNSEKFDSDSMSECSIDVDSSFSKEMDVKDVNEAIVEMSQAVHKYMNKIKHLDISVEWKLPKTLKARKGFRKSESGLKGPLEPEEVSYLKRRLRQFCEEYNINYGEIRACLADKVSKFQFPNELRLKFVQYLCKDYVNDRNPLTVFRAISKLGLRKGKFSEGEEKFLADMYHTYRGSYLHSVCGLMLNRHRTSVFKKIERMKNKNFLGLRPSSNNVKTKPLKLRKLILSNVLNRRNYDLERLKYRFNTRSWMSIGKEYNVSPALAKAIYICELFPQIYAVHPVKFNRFFVNLLCRIKRSDWNTWEEVKWNELSNLLYGVGPFFVYIMLRKIIIHCVPKEKWNNFKECAKYLFKNVLPYFENGPKKITLNSIMIQLDETDH